MKPLLLTALTLALAACGSGGPSDTIQPLTVPDHAQANEPAATPVPEASPDPVQAPEDNPEPVNPFDTSAAGETEPTAEEPSPEPVAPTPEPLPEVDPVVTLPPTPAPPASLTPAETVPAVPTPFVDVVDTVFYAEAILLDEYRETLPGVVEPWTVAAIHIEWEPLPDYTYHLIYDGEEAPGTISSPWGLDAEFPVSIDVFTRDMLPTLHIKSCTQGECITSRDIGWPGVSR